MLRELQLLGLTNNESIVYESLVKYGPCKAGEIIAKVDTHRNVVYRALESLVLNGYATKVVKRGVWEFQITDPQSLLTGMRRREQLVAEVVGYIEQYQTHSRQQIVVYEGLESYRSYWMSSLKRVPVGTIDYVAGAKIEGWNTLMGPAYAEYLAIAVKKKIVWKQLYFDMTESELLLLRRVSVNHESRLLDFPMPLPYHGNFNIVHDTIILHTMTGIPRIVEMRDSSLVVLFSHYFNVMWSMAKSVQ